jgi:hypothetical protein
MSCLMQADGIADEDFISATHWPKEVTLTKSDPYVFIGVNNYGHRTLVTVRKGATMKRIPVFAFADKPSCIRLVASLMSIS